MINQEKINKLPVEKFLSYNLHWGSPKVNLNLTTKPYIQGIRNNFCILNLKNTYLDLRTSLKYLKKLLAYRKKILFIGGPKGMEREFAFLCRENQHFWIGKWSDGIFTNLKRKFAVENDLSIKIKIRPSLIFIFDLTLHEHAKQEASPLGIPIMAFVNTDENLENIDYPILANINSWKGGLFVYNLFFHFLSIYKNQLK